MKKWTKSEVERGRDVLPWQFMDSNRDLEVVFLHYSTCGEILLAMQFTWVWVFKDPYFYSGPIYFHEYQKQNNNS